jgi:hypothetical protein
MLLSSVALASLAAVAQSYLFAPEQGSALGPERVRDRDGAVLYDALLMSARFWPMRQSLTI